MDENSFMNEFINFMTREGLSNTQQRRAIAEAFFSFPGHHTNEEFYKHVADLDPKIGQTTVYRTLKLLCAAGLASEIQFADNVARYEVANPNRHHDHLICLKCGEIIEIFDPDIERMQLELARRHNFILKGHVHNLYGICQNCSQYAEES